MTVYGHIFDNQVNAYIPRASIQVTNRYGDLQGAGTSEDNNGYFTIANAALDQGGKLLISSIGYKSILVDPSVIIGKGGIGLDEDPTMLQAATVTAKAPAQGNWKPLLIASAARLLLLTTRKKKKNILTAMSCSS